MSQKKAKMEELQPILSKALKKQAEKYSKGKSKKSDKAKISSLEKDVLILKGNIKLCQKNRQLDSCKKNLEKK